MKQQKEKKRKVNKNLKSASSTFPRDLTSEILQRLPDKSVARFRCVSKLWLSITTDPYFINLLETRSPRPSVFVFFDHDDKWIVSSIPQHPHTLQNSNKSYTSSHLIDRYCMNPVVRSNFPPTESVHGLICFQEASAPIVWNPRTKQFYTLPKPRMNWEGRLTFFLGYDPIEGKHKVMYILSRRSSDVCRVLTLGSAKESWRTVKTNHRHRCSDDTFGRCIKGVVYYIAYGYHTSGWVLMSFDVRSEKFDMIQLPSNIQMDTLMNFEGRLACVMINMEDDNSIRNNEITLCILEDAEKRKWSSKCFLAPLFHRDESSGTFLTVKGITHAGEFIYGPFKFCKSSYILFCDPVKNRFRKFERKGITDECVSLYLALHAF